jgi:hypothetical protein
MRQFAVYLLAAWVGLGFATGVSASEQAFPELKSNVEKLYLNYIELERIYKDLHNVAVDEINGPDMQLSYIQKAYLFVSEANLIGYTQWRFLSITPYIKTENISDFFTLGVKDVDKAAFESRDRVNSLKLYYSYIDSQPARKLIDAAIGIIEGNIYIYEQIHETLRPLTNTPEQFQEKI